MTTEANQESGTTVQDQETTTTEPTMQELVQKEIAKFQEQSKQEQEHFKKEIAGLNRKISEQDKTIEEKDLDQS